MKFWMAVLFVSLVGTGAYSQPKGEYSFWPEMPEAAQVTKDIQGKDELDTAARRLAAFELLDILVVRRAESKGQLPWPAREGALHRAYIFAVMPDNIFHDTARREAVRAQSLRYQADPSFTRPFLRRYFSEASLREIEPIVSNFEANARARISRPPQTGSVFDNQPQVNPPPQREVAMPAKDTNTMNLFPPGAWLLAALLLAGTLLLPVIVAIRRSRRIGFFSLSGEVKKKDTTRPLDAGQDLSLFTRGVVTQPALIADAAASHASTHQRDLVPLADPEVDATQFDMFFPFCGLQEELQLPDCI